MLQLTVRVCKGANDHLLPWPMRETFYLKFVQPNGECLEDYIELDTRRMQATKNGPVRSRVCASVHKIEKQVA